MDDIYINGRITDQEHAMIQAKDQGFLFGFGIFETLRVYNGIPFMLTQHVQRLLQAASNIGIDCLSLEEFRSEISNYIKAIHLSEGVVRITVTKGFSKPNIIFTQREVGYDASSYEQGFALKTSSVKRNASSPLTYMKTTNYLDNMLAKREAIKEGFDEALFMNADNLISECSASNIFFIQDTILYTPATKCGLLNGIVRTVILQDIAKVVPFQIKEGEFCLESLYQAEEVFITNSVLQIMPVVKIDKHIIGKGKPGSNTKRIIEQYKTNVYNTCYRASKS